MEWVGKHRIVTLADSLIPVLRQQITYVGQLLGTDCSNPYYSGVWLPHRLRLKYKSIQWQYLFPSKKLSKDLETQQIRRHHIDESSIQKASRKANKLTTIQKRITLIHYVIPLLPICYNPGGYKDGARASWACRSAHYTNLHTFFATSGQ